MLWLLGGFLGLLIILYGGLYCLVNSCLLSFLNLLSLPFPHLLLLLPLPLRPLLRLPHNPLRDILLDLPKHRPLALLGVPDPLPHRALHLDRSAIPVFLGCPYAGADHTGAIRAIVVVLVGVLGVVVVVGIGGHPV